MSKSIISEVQERLGGFIHKIDANDPAQDKTTHPESTNHLEQAAVSALLVALYEYMHQEEGKPLASLSIQEGLGEIFHAHLPEVVQAIAQYAKVEASYVSYYLIHAYEVILATIHEIAGTRREDILKLFKEQKESILSTLPSSLGLGNLLEHSALEDRTHKMDGILSSFTKMLGQMLNA